MKILHVLSQFEVTGAEAYAVTLGDAQLSAGHEVVLVSDTLHLPFRGTYIAHPIGQRGYTQRWRNIRFLVDLIRKRRIDVVHAHSRAASWVCNIACRRTNTAFVSTVHGRQHLHTSSRAINIYGRHIIAVAESLREHLLGDLGIDPTHVETIPNPIELEKYGRARTPRRASSPRERRILYVGRFSGPKGDVLRLLLKEVVPMLRERGSWRLDILAGGKIPEDIREAAESLNANRQRPCVSFHGLQKNPTSYFLAADVVVGSGRVAMEALAAQRPVVAFGESACFGLITEMNVDAAAKTNFGDTGKSELVTPAFVAGEIQRAAKVRLNRSVLRDWIRDRYAVSLIATRVQAVYGRALLQSRLPKTIPILMYHRVVAAPPQSKHGIWVTTKEFRSQLAALKRRGFTPITFADLEAVRVGEKRLEGKPLLLTFDDGYEDNYTHAFPLLKEFSFRAVVYLVTDKKRRTNFWDAEEAQVPLLNEKQIREMVRAGIEFGSHTTTHPHLTKLSQEKITSEIAQSKRRTEELSGTPALSFAYPYGEFNEETKEAARQTGFTFAVVGDAGPFALWEDLLAIRRITMFPGTSSFNFWKKTQPWYTRYKAWKKLKP